MPGHLSDVRESLRDPSCATLRFVVDTVAEVMGMMRTYQPAGLPPRGWGRLRRTGRKQIYMQRYTSHFPAADEVAIFDRSWRMSRASALIYYKKVPREKIELPEPHKGAKIRAGEAL